MGLLLLSSQNVENIKINTTAISERFCFFCTNSSGLFLSKYLQHDVIR